MGAKVRLRVLPDGQPEFDSETRVRGMDAVQQLAVGRETYVLYDPKHPEHCDIDRERLREEFGPRRDGHDRVVILTAMQASFEEKMSARASDPAAYAQHRQEMLARAAALQADPAAAQQQATAPRPDIATQLTKLADLRDRGVLSEEEFAAEKAKLLSQP